MSEVNEVADAKDALLPVNDHPIFSEETEDLTNRLLASLVLLNS